jgi:hypothetical protein
MRLVRRGVVALVLVVALAPATAAFAEDGNQAAIDKARAEQLWLSSLPVLERGVAMGQHEISNARAIAKLVSNDKNAQMQIPNSMEMYRVFCAQAVVQLQAGLTNAQAMALLVPAGDPHAQAEIANATVKLRELWEMIGDSYPGNPYRTHYAEEPAFVADEEMVVADAEGEFVTAEAEFEVAIGDDLVN